MVLLMGTTSATAGRSDHVITFESTWDADNCRIINLSGPYGFDGEYYRVAKLCWGNEGEYVKHYEIPVKYIK